MAFSEFFINIYFLKDFIYLLSVSRFVLISSPLFSFCSFVPLEDSFCQHILFCPLTVKKEKIRKE